LVTKQRRANADEITRIRKYLSNRENFVSNIIKPILRIHRVCGVLPMKKELSSEKRLEMLQGMISMSISDRSCRRLFRSCDDISSIQPTKQLKKVMMAWLPAANVLVDMIAAHVPLPVSAQKLRAQLLYSGDIQDASGKGILHCDTTGPVVVYISKMIPLTNNNNQLLAFGRVFSGTICTGDNLRAIRTNSTETKVQIAQIKLCGIGGKMHSMPRAYAGQLIAIEGINEDGRE
jgi:translation elongation factor EF-G